MEASKVPQDVIDVLEEYRTYDSEYRYLSYRNGTDGVRGLYPKMKSLRSKMHKTQLKLEGTGWKLSFSYDYPYVFVKKLETDNQQ